MSARQEKVREALSLLTSMCASGEKPTGQSLEVTLAAHDEVEAWELHRKNTDDGWHHYDLAEMTAVAWADHWRHRAEELEATLTRITEAGHRANIEEDCGCGKNPCPNAELIDALAAARGLVRTA